MNDHPIDEAEAADRELKRQRLLAFLRREEPVWRDEDHPEIVALGSAEWVRSLRDRKSERQIELEKRFAED
jgi:hypothetical protein